MKSNAKSKIMVLIALGILLGLSPINTVNLSFIAGNNSENSNCHDNINSDKEYLKISAISGKIRITNNSGWVDFKNAGNCTGNGTYSDPYVIEDLIIDPGRWVTCIVIENSDVYFRIENCSLLHSGGAVRLSNVNNSMIIKNNCSSNSNGIDLWRCNNSTISGNTANNNDDWGISLSDCNNSTISGNTANNNGEGIYLYYSHDINASGNTANNNDDWGIFLASIDYTTFSGNTANNNKYGIFLSYSDYNTISGNTANDNKRGIYLHCSRYNTISGNTFLGNDECIVEENCEGNIFENNDCGIIPGYNLFFLLGALSVAVILTSKKLKKP
ncbi:hypothetical protein ES707_10408 [subsurface metagenome]